MHIGGPNSPRAEPYEGEKNLHGLLERGRYPILHPHGSVISPGNSPKINCKKLCLVGEGVPGRQGWRLRLTPFES